MPSFLILDLESHPPRAAIVVEDLKPIYMSVVWGRPTPQREGAAVVYVEKQNYGLSAQFPGDGVERALTCIGGGRAYVTIDSAR